MMIQDPAADSVVKEPAAVVAEEDRSLGNSDRSLNNLPKVDLDDYGDDEDKNEDYGNSGIKDEDDNGNEVEQETMAPFGNEHQFNKRHSVEISVIQILREINFGVLEFLKIAIFGL